MSQAVANTFVKRGAKLLDKKIPGWHKKVAISTLQMDNGCRCVLGQIAGKAVNLDQAGWEAAARPDYFDMTNLVGVPSFDDEVRAGFNANASDDEFPDDVVLYRGRKVRVTYSELKKAWIAAIRERHNAEKYASAS